MCYNPAMLTRKELAFIDEYFLCGLRGSDAARRCGSKSPRMYAHRMLSNVNIQAEIDKRLARHKMSSAMVLARLSDMAMSNIADFTDIEDTSDLRKYRHKTHVIKKFKKTVHHTRDNETFTTIEIELYGADSALVNLGRHYKLFTDSVKIDDWRTELLTLLREGKITKEEVLNEFAGEVPQGLLESFGISTDEVGKAEVDSAIEASE